MLALGCGIAIVSFALASSGGAQTAYISDAWWTYQQDCNGDTCKAGALPGDKARLNWVPNVTNCDGTLTVSKRSIIARAAPPHGRQCTPTPRT